MSAGTGFIGRNCVLKWNGAVVAGAREKSVAVNGEPIDVTDDNSSGWRELLAEDGTKSVDITLSGVIKSSVLRTAKMTGGAATIGTLTLEYEDGGVLSGTFKLISYTETAPYNEGMTFEAPFQSTGQTVYTPAP